jgi:hypothetical protein
MLNQANRRGSEPRSSHQDAEEAARMKAGRNPDLS